MNDLLAQIAQMYQDIAGIHLAQRAVDDGSNSLMSAMNSALISMYPPVTITSDCKVLLSRIAEQLLGFTLPDDFFNLGNLSKDSLNPAAFGQPTVAFPTAIFLKSAADSISYTITSRNSADIIYGTINIVNSTGENLI